MLADSLEIINKYSTLNAIQLYRTARTNRKKHRMDGMEWKKNILRYV